MNREFLWDKVNNNNNHHNLIRELTDLSLDKELELEVQLVCNEKSELVVGINIDVVIQY
jgi:hypothetical protein